MQLRLKLIALAIAVALCGAWGGVAYADTLTTASVHTTAGSYKNTVLKVSAKEKAAYNRALAACMDYENQPNPIVVDVSDLGLSKKQVEAVSDLLQANGELFWFDGFLNGLCSFNQTQFTLGSKYDDATINAMRKKLDARVKVALKRIGPGMAQSAKVHMLHDWLIDNMEYKAKKRSAYDGLVLGKGDCFGYALAMDVLLRRAGFSTDMAFSERIDHAWNVVKVGSHWYHVDVRWDDSLSWKRNSDYFNWKNERCHLYLLQSDSTMSSYAFNPNNPDNWISSHLGWTCHHKCSDSTFDAWSVCGAGGKLSKKCDAWKSIVRSFKSGGVKYVVTGVKQVKVASVTGKKQRKAKSLMIPASVKYKGVKYNVCGIASGALAKAKAGTLKVGTGKLSKARVTGSLKGSRVVKVKLVGAAKKKRTAYQKYFAEENCGKLVLVA